MKKIILIFLVFFLCSPLSFAGTTVNPETGGLDKTIDVTEEDGAPIAYAPETIKFANGNVTVNADGTVSIADQTGAGGGDPVLVNTTAISDASGVDLTSGTEVTITLNAAVSPDTATLGLASAITRDTEWDTEAEVQTAWGSVNIILATEIDTSAELLAVVTDETGSASGTPLAVFNQNPTINGAVLTGVIDGGGATSTEVENAAGNVTIGEAGAVGVDTTNKQFVVFDGTNELVVPLRHVAQGTFDLAAQWDVDNQLWLIDLDSDQYPNGIYITAVTLDCTVADPTTEFLGDLKYCDAVAGGAFPGATPTVIVVMDSTTGNYSNTSVNTAVATGKSLYIEMDSDPTDSATQWHLKIKYYIEED